MLFISCSTLFIANYVESSIKEFGLNLEILEKFQEKKIYFNRI